MTQLNELIGWPHRDNQSYLGHSVIIFTILSNTRNSPIPELGYFSVILWGYGIALNMSAIFEAHRFFSNYSNNLMRKCRGFFKAFRSFLARPLTLAAMSDLRSGVLHLPGVFWNSFLKETSQQDGRNKNWTMKRLLHGTLRLRYSPTGEQIQNGRPTDEIQRDPITPWCGPPPFCPCFSLAETSVLKIS